MNRFLDDFVPYIPIIILVCFICFYEHKETTTKEPVKAEPVETLVPTHTAKCTETKGSTCITYTIYRVTNP